MFGDMPQLFEIAADSICLLPRHGQDVNVARVALDRDSALDANGQWLFWLPMFVAIAGEPLKVIADHTLAEACSLADLALAGKATPLSVARPASHRSTNLRADCRPRSDTHA
ncbi:MAG: hypothetical protein ACR2IK_11020 [Chloroflexota bacterium]